METIRSTANKRRNKRRLNVRRVILAVLALFVLIGAVIAIVFGIKSCTTAVKKRSLPFKNGTTYAYTGDGFLYMDGRTLRFFSLTDEKNNFSEELQYDPKGVTGTAELKAIYTGSSVQIVNTRHDNSFDGAILKTAVGSKYLAVYVENLDGTKQLIVYNSAGDRCWSEDYTESTLLDFGFEGGSSDVFYTSELVIKGNGVSTAIKTRDIKRQSNTGDLYVQGQIVKKVFVTKKSVFAYGTDSVIRFDRSTNKETYRVLCNGWECLDASCNKDRMNLLLQKTNDRDGSLSVLSLKEGSSAEESTYPITDVKDNLACFMLVGKAVSVHSDKLVIYGQKGTVEKTVAFETPVTGAAKLDDGSIVVFTADGTALYTFK